MYAHVKYVIYAGAAPGMYALHIAKYFPNMKFILVDPVKFELFYYYAKKELRPNERKEHGDIPANFAKYTVEELKQVNQLAEKYKDKIAHLTMADCDLGQIALQDAQIFIFNEYFTNAHAEKFAKLKSKIFISDIRTTYFGELPSDADILINNAMQYRWIKILNPLAYCCKFRFPYYDEPITRIEANINSLKFDMMCDDIDLLKDYKDKRMRYLDGNLYLQAFAPAGSSETRLIGTTQCIVEYMRVEEYENKMYFHNTLNRGFIFHCNSNAIERIGFDECFDCALESAIWELYCKNTGNKLDIRKEVINLSEFLKHPLKRVIHGNMFHANEKKYCECFAKVK
jgi:hypothetical protein